MAVLLVHYNSYAQRKTIQVSGQAIDALSKRPVADLQIINTTTRDRFTGDSLGRFKIVITKLDSLFITATGYSSQVLSFRDSSSHDKYSVLIRMNQIEIELPNVNVHSNRDFDQIHRDAQKLGYDPKDYMVHGFNVINSPLTAIYQQTSNKEKDKRGYAELMNKVHQRQLLHEILQKYMDLGVIKLQPDEEGPFLDFCDIPEIMLKNSLEYDIVAYMKEMYPKFLAQKK